MAAFRRLVRTFTGGGPMMPTPESDGQPVRITKDNLFDVIPPECDYECESCTIKYPAGFKIEEDTPLFGTGKPYATHIVIATGKSDWVRDVADEKGSIMEALGNHKKPSNGRLMVSASNMCPPEEYHTETGPKPTTCLLLPSFTMIDRVTPDDVPELVESFINPGPTTSTPLNPDEGKDEDNSPAQSSSNGVLKKDDDEDDTEADAKSPTEALAQLSVTSHLKSYECPHDYIILMCSHKRRDARCGQSAPLLLKEFRRHLHPLGLYRDLDDHRPGGVGIYFINHVGGHKWSANMMIYRKKAGQGIWLGRVVPKDIEGIVKWTVLEGKVSPDKIRAGFDRSRGLTSW